MRRKPYKARTITGAERKVRYLENMLKKYVDAVHRFHKDNLLLAKLAAKGPAFSNPIEAAEAEKIRDRLLAQMNMNPDGSFFRRRG